MDAWDKLNDLRRHPELADNLGYELDKLYTEGDPIYWFLFLMEQPQLAPPRDWWFSLRHRSDLPWARLLAIQPQFEGYFSHVRKKFFDSRVVPVVPVI